MPLSCPELPLLLEDAAKRNLPFRFNTPYCQVLPFNPEHVPITLKGLNNNSLGCEPGVYEGQLDMGAVVERVLGAEHLMSAQWQ